MTFRSTANNNQPNGTSCVVTKPAGTVDNTDVLVLRVIMFDPGFSASVVAFTITPPTGFVLRDRTNYAGGTGANSSAVAIYTKLCGTEGANYTVNFGQAVYADCDMHAYSGEDGGSASAHFDQITANTGTGTTATGTGFTASRNGSDLLFFTTNNTTATQAPTPTGFTPRLNYDGNCDLFDKSINAGATGSPTTALASSTWIVHLMALQPVASAALLAPGNWSQEPPAKLPLPSPSTRGFTDTSMLTAITTVTLTSIGWVGTGPARGAPYKPQRAEVMFAGKILPLQSAVMQWTEPPRKGAPFPPLRPVNQADFGTRIIPVISASTGWMERGIPWSLVQQQPRLLFVDSASANTITLSTFVETPALAIGKWKPARVPEESVLGTRITTFTSTWSSWSSDPARRGTQAQPVSETNDQFFGEFMLGQLPWSSEQGTRWKPTPKLGSSTDAIGSPFPFAPSPTFTGWTSDAVKAPKLPAEQDNTEQVFGPLMFGQLPWTSDSSPRWTKTAQPPAETFLGTPFPFAPNPSFVGWTSDSPAKRFAAPLRPADQQVLGMLPSAYSAWAEPVLRSQQGTRPQAFQNDALDALSQLPPTVYAPWTSDPPQTWKKPAYRPDVQPITSAVTVLAYSPFLAWADLPVRGTAVTSRRAEPPSYLGTFIPPPVLTGTPWDTGMVRPAPTRPTNASSSVMPASAWSGVSPYVLWAAEPAKQATYSRQPDQGWDPGTRITAVSLSAYQPFTNEPGRAYPRTRPPENSGDVGTRITTAATSSFYAFAGEPYRLQLRTWQPDQPTSLGARLAASPSFDFSSEPPIRGQQRTRQPDQANSVGQVFPQRSAYFPLTSEAPQHPQRAAQPQHSDIASVEAAHIVILPSLGWHTFELPPRSPWYQSRPGIQDYSIVYIDVFIDEVILVGALTLFVDDNALTLSVDDNYYTLVEE